MQHQKVKSVAKLMQSRGPGLRKDVLETLGEMSRIVGDTLGPGGRAVLIERQETGLPPMITKDGVTAIRNLGFTNSTRHAIMEAARDASTRTATEAGDGTTTATILMEAMVRYADKFTNENPRFSPQKVVRRIEKLFREEIEPLMRSLSTKPDFTTDEGQRMLHSVAKVSANGDVELADAVMKCFGLVGDEGNVTIAEQNGPSRYEVEKIKGFPVNIGYEDCGQRFYNEFINDPGAQRVYLEKPKFVLYHGSISEPSGLMALLRKVGYEVENSGHTPNIVVAAMGFSEQVLAWLSMMFKEAQALNVYPLLIPSSPFPNGQVEFLEDLAAVTGADVLSQIGITLEEATLDQLGPGLEYFEATRFRSNVVGRASEDLIFLRVDELKAQESRSESQLDLMYLQERIAKMTMGIAKLKVVGVSNGETKEKRDRAVDAVCAVRGAIKHGVLPGGTWTLLRTAYELSGKFEDDRVVASVLVPALEEPFHRLLTNIGVVDQDEFTNIQHEISDFFNYPPLDARVYDALEGKLVKAFEEGILDSTPAVLEATRNSLSIASILGTLGGTIVFARDLDTERTEARDRLNWERDTNPADERA